MEKQLMKRQYGLKLLWKYFSLGAVILLAALWLMPIVLVVMNASKSFLDFSDGNIWRWPTGFHLLQNLRDAWTMGNLSQGFYNSLIFSVCGATFSILIAALAAHGIIIMRIGGGFYWFLLIYSGTVFPFQMYLIPLYQGYKMVGLYNSYLGMILFYTAIAIPFCLFLLRNYLQTVSYEIVEAARMDGASSFGIFLKIIMPMLVSPIAVLYLFQFTWIWNDLIFGMILTQSPGMRPVMAGLTMIQGTLFRTGVTRLLAAILITSLPTVLLFFLLQKNFIKGMQLSVKP